MKTLVQLAFEARQCVATLQPWSESPQIRLSPPGKAFSGKTLVGRSLARRQCSTRWDPSPGFDSRFDLGSEVIVRGLFS